MEYLKRIYQSVSSEKNKSIFGITTCGGIVCGWNIAGLDLLHLLPLEIVWKAVAGFFTVIVGPPIGVFMKDVYQIKVKPKIFKDKHKY